MVGVRLGSFICGDGFGLHSLVSPFTSIFGVAGRL